MRLSPLQNPILRGREPDATEKDRTKGNAKGAELGRLVNQFILRRYSGGTRTHAAASTHTPASHPLEFGSHRCRTNTILSDHLPPKLVCVVCCSMSKVQSEMYRTFLASKIAKQLENGGKQTQVQRRGSSSRSRKHSRARLSPA